jgi:hypothetical protein
MKAVISKMKSPAKFGKHVVAVALAQIKLNWKSTIDLYWKLATNSEFIIVHQMGKVGSMSILRSLESYCSQPVFHVHRMVFNPEQKINRRIYKHIIKRQRSAKIITPFREPISRNISAFFENLHQFIPQFTREKLPTISTPDLLSIFINKFPHWTPLAWFDLEMKQALGIDIYASDFPKDRGYCVLNAGHAEVLIIKARLDDAIKERAIGDFLNLPDFKITRSNVAESKYYANRYREFISTVKLPESYVNIMCNSTYMKHFYSEAEIASVKQRWYGRTTGDALPPSMYNDMLGAASRNFESISERACRPI